MKKNIILIIAATVSSVSMAGAEDFFRKVGGDISRETKKAYGNADEALNEELKDITTKVKKGFSETDKETKERLTRISDSLRESARETESAVQDGVQRYKDQNRATLDRVKDDTVRLRDNAGAETKIISKDIHDRTADQSRDLEDIHLSTLSEEKRDQAAEQRRFDDGYVITLNVYDENDRLTAIYFSTNAWQEDIYVVDLETMESSRVESPTRGLAEVEKSDLDYIRDAMVKKEQALLSRGETPQSSSNFYDYISGMADFSRELSSPARADLKATLKKQLVARSAPRGHQTELNGRKVRIEGVTH